MRLFNISCLSLTMRSNTPEHESEMQCGLRSILFVSSSPQHTHSQILGRNHGAWTLVLAAVDKKRGLVIVK
jgi:hypothetical protein